MIINNAQVQLNSEHQFVSLTQHNLVVNQQSPGRPANTATPLISPQALESEAAMATQQLETDKKNLELEISLLKQLIERLTGKRIKLLRLSQDPPSIDPQQSSSVSTLPNSGQSFSITQTSTHQESEKMTFEARARVHTADGREIDIMIDLHYSRSLEITSNFSLQTGENLKDPLVLNFSGTSPQLKQTHYEFDLDVDGTLDRMPVFNGNSALLALDKNRDVTINDGSELFGAVSGDGFSELAAYDEDGNGWIDEADSVFSELRLMRIDNTGQQQLISLKDNGVGALYLGNVVSPFELHSDLDGQAEGLVRSSGIYLNEDGKAGVMQQIDLSI